MISMRWSGTARRWARPGEDGTSLRATTALVHFMAIVLTAVALIPVGAHLFELPNKIDLPAREYFIVQGIYDGWFLFGIALFGAMAANLALAILVRKEPTAFRLALAGFLAITLSLVIFLVWTYPTNRATSNWTVIPAQWEALRTQWEYSHAAAALTSFLALCSVAAAACVRLPFSRGDHDHG